MRHRWRRRVVRIAAVLLAASLLALATQGWWLRALALPQIRRLTGLRPEVAAIGLTWSGRVRIASLTLSQETMDRAEPIVEAPEIQATIHWLGLLRARLELRRIVMTHPVIRIPAPGESSRRRGATKPGSSRAHSSVAALPDVRIDDGVFEFIQTNKGQPQQVVTFTGDGTLRRRPSDSTLSDLTIELMGAGDRVVLAGWINPSQRTASLSAHDVDLPRWIDTWSFDRDAEQWRSICTAGRLVSATVTYSTDNGLISRLKVEGVSLALPSPTHDDREPKMYTIEDVSGEVNIDNDAVEAQLTGLIDGLPTRAKLATEGLSTTTPFRLDLSGGPFVFDQKWTPITLAPLAVHALLDEFSAPSAELEGHVTLRRDTGSSSFDEGISISGEAKIVNGSASFVEFPYPLHEIAGAVRFDDSMIRIDRLTGVGPSGARISAEGTVKPDAEGAGVDLKIHSEDTPVDEFLLKAIGKKNRAIVEKLFDRTLFDRLNDEGVFITSAQQKTAQRSADRLENELKNAVENGLSERAAGLRAQLAEMNARRSAPEFDLAGSAQIDATVVRRPGASQRPHVEADVRFDRAGIVHRSFPYPVWGEPLEAHLGRDRIDVVSARLVGLTGAIGAISGSITYDPQPDSPELLVKLEQAPVDETLLSALALIHGDQTDHDTLLHSRSTAFVKALRRLSPQGKVSGSARVSHAHAGAQYEVTVPLEGLRLAPNEGSEQTPLVIDDFTGAMRITHDGMRIEDATAMVGASPVHFSLTALNENTSPIDVSLQSDSFRVDEPIEQLIGAFDPLSASRLTNLRSGLDINGRIALVGQLTISGGSPQYTFELTPSSALTIGSGSGASTLTPTQGRVIVEPQRLLFDDLTYEISTPNSPSPGRVSVTGEIFLHEGDGELSIDTTGLPIGSSAVAVAVKRIAPKVSAWFDTAHPRGRVDASLSLQRSAGKWRVARGTIHPHSLSFNRQGARIALEIESGEITIDPDGGAVRDWRARAEHWSLNADGRWFAGTTPGVDVQLSADGDRLSDDLIALLPAKAAHIIRRFDLRANQGFLLRKARLSINAPSQGGDVGAGFRDGARFEGDVHLAGTRIHAGAPFIDADGEIHLVVARPPQVDSVSIDAELRLDRLRAAGLTAVNITGGVHSSNLDPHALDIELSGASHGGRVWSNGVISNFGSSSQAPGRYEFEVRAAGVDLASAMRDFTRDGTDEGAAPEQRRGQVDGSMVFGGELSSSSVVHGAGDIRILGGELAKLPLVMRILEIGDLIPASREALDYARAHFTMKGDVLTFDRIIAVSETMSMIGQGTVTTPDMALDLRFGTTGNRRLPVLSAVVDALRNELLTTRVRGTLADPRFSVVQLSTTRRWLSKLLGLDGDRKTPKEATEPAPAGKPD